MVTLEASGWFSRVQMTVLGSFPRHHDSDSGRLPGARFARVNRLLLKNLIQRAFWASGTATCLHTDNCPQHKSQGYVALQASLSTPVGVVRLASATSLFGTY